MSRREAAVLSWAVRRARRDELSALPDRDLLRRYAESADQAAFAALAGRHAAMVLGVCKRALANEQDAEDACQAVFLILARKAATSRWQPSLANWLHTTARKVAGNARLAAQRRARREGMAAVPEAVRPADVLSGREVAELLDEELERLPPRYREPLVLCCLEGLTRDEAAERLGVPVGALKGQLERGRKKLADALAARGYALGLGLVVTSSARAVSPRLADMVLAAAGGSPPAAVAALAREVVVNVVLSQVKLLALAAVGLVALGLGLASLAPAAPKPTGADRPASAAGKADAPKKKTLRTVTGKVLGPDGRPLAATLSLLWLDGKHEPLGDTAADGTFKVTVPLRDPGANLVARAKGHGLDFMMPATNTPADVTFRLPKDHPIKGRVLDTQGKPVAGARVAAHRVILFEKQPAERSLKRWQAELRERGVPLPEGDRNLWLPDDKEFAADHPLAARTGKDGAFEIHGVGTDRLAGLVVRGDGVADSRLGVMNRAGFDPKPYNEDHGDRERMRFSFAYRSRRLFGPEPSVVLEREKILRGRVSDADGKPRAGVRVTFSPPNRRDLNPDHNFAFTGADGRYEIRGARKQKGYMVECDPEPKAGLLPCQAFADDTVGYEPITLDLKCARGLVVTGRVKDKATGKPLPAHVYVSVLANNPFVKDYPPFLHSASMAYESSRSEADGRFRVVTIPGQVLLMVAPRGEGQVFKPVKADPAHPSYFHTRFGHLGYYGLDSSYGIVQGNWCKVLLAKKGDAEVRVDVELERATSQAARVVDADGKPVQGAHATGLTHLDYEHPQLQVGDLLTLFNVDEAKGRLVAVAHAKRRLVGTATVRAGDEKAVVKLGPGGVVTGRVVDPDGKPLAGVTVSLHYATRVVAEASRPLGETDQNPTRHEARSAVSGPDGAFRFDALFPGQEFRLLFSKGKKRFDPDYDRSPKRVVARHGDDLKLGDVEAKAKEIE